MTTGFLVGFDAADAAAHVATSTARAARSVTRTVRQSLEKIRDELVVTYKIIDKAGSIAKVSAQRAKADVSQLNVTLPRSSRAISVGRESMRGLRTP